MATFQFFSVQGTGGSPTGPDPEIRVGDQDNGSAGRPIYSYLDCFRPAVYIQQILLN